MNEKPIRNEKLERLLKWFRYKNAKNNAFERHERNVAYVYLSVRGVCFIGMLLIVGFVCGIYRQGPIDNGQGYVPTVFVYLLTCMLFIFTWCALAPILFGLWKDTVQVLRVLAGGDFLACIIFLAFSIFIGKGITKANRWHAPIPTTLTKRVEDVMFDSLEQQHLTSWIADDPVNVMEAKGVFGLLICITIHFGLLCWLTLLYLRYTIRREVDGGYDGSNQHKYNGAHDVRQPRNGCQSYQNTALPDPDRSQAENRAPQFPPANYSPKDEPGYASRGSSASYDSYEQD